MEREFLNTLNLIEYYYEEYQKGDEDALLILKDFFKEIKSRKKVNIKYYYQFSLIILFLKCRVFLFSPNLLEEKEYQNLIGYSDKDVKYYREVFSKLFDYINYCIKNNCYEHLDDAFVLSVRISWILENITKYITHIENLQHYAYSNILYKYPSTVEKDREEVNREIDVLLKKLKIEE